MLSFVRKIFKKKQKPVTEPVYPWTKYEDIIDAIENKISVNPICSIGVFNSIIGCINEILSDDVTLIGESRFGIVVLSQPTSENEKAFTGVLSYFKPAGIMIQYVDLFKEK